MRKSLYIILITILFSNILYAQNGWQAQNLPAGVNKTTRLNFVNSSTGFLMANGIYKTTDAGNSWVQKTVPFDVNALYSLSFLNSSTGYFCQLSNTIYKTTNGGENWQMITSDNYPYSMKFINVNTGWFVQGRVVTKTTDGGLNYKFYNLGDTVLAMFCLDFINDNTGWVAGMRDIFKTTDGGLSWNAKGRFETSPNKMAYAMDFLNEATGFLAGAGGMICKTTDGGDTWVKSYPGNATLRDITFLNNQTGWASGGGGNLFKTTDTGNNWIKYDIDTSLYLIDMEFINQNTGWITTNTNKLLKTTNGGNVFIMQTSSNVPDNFTLGQNYPNPFNPSTNINYSLKRSGLISLKIYYIDGKEIENLVNENQSEGDYRVTFDASRLPSGAYFYKLESGNFSETKKMILVK